MTNPFNQKIDKSKYKLAGSSEERFGRIINEIRCIDKRIKRPRIGKR